MFFTLSTFCIGTILFPLKVAIQNKIKLIIYGDGVEERATGNPNNKKLNKKFETLEFFLYRKNNDDIFLEVLK